MALNDLKASPGREEELQALLDKLYKDYVDELDLMVEEAADEIETAVERGLVDKQQIVADWAQTAAQRADDYYQAVREAWKEYAGVDMPTLDSYGLVDVNQALWETQSQLVNERYIGMRYQDAISGRTKYGVTVQDLWPSMENIDDAQQFIADMMRNSARLQTMHDMRHDPTHPRWARVPSGARTCAFCMMLASRGFAYLSDETAGRGGSRYHEDCDCKVIPSWGKQTLKGYDLDAYKRIYRQSVDEAGKNADWHEVLKQMRRSGGSLVSDHVEKEPWGSLPWKEEKQLLSMRHEKKGSVDSWRKRQEAIGMDPRVERLEPHEIVFLERFQGQGQHAEWIPKSTIGEPTNDFKWVERDCAAELKSVASMKYRSIAGRISKAVDRAKEKGVVKDVFVIDVGDAYPLEKTIRKLENYNNTHTNKIRELWIFNDGGLHEVRLD